VESPLPRIAAINTSFPAGNLFHPGSASLGAKVLFFESGFRRGTFFGKPSL
jgi:hypothetical protein